MGGEGRGPSVRVCVTGCFVPASMYCNTAFFSKFSISALHVGNYDVT